MAKVAVLDDWQGVARGSTDWSPLEARAEVVFFAQAFEDEDDAARKLADFDIILSMRERTPLPASLINRLPRLRMLGMTGARNASLDTACCTTRGVLVCNTDYGAAPKPPLRSWHLAYFCRRHERSLLPTRISAPDDSRRACRSASAWREKPSALSVWADWGRSWRATAGRLNMTVLAWSQNLTAEKALAAGAVLVSKEALLAQSDAVSIHVVLSLRSRGLIGGSDIALMKPGAILINTSRGPIVDEAALLEAVQSRPHRRGARRL